jgi:hypothetical protein
MSSEPSQLNGLIVSATISWIRSTYGDELVERALLQLSNDQRASFKKLVISIGWYDVALYEKFIDLCFQEVQKKTGETRERFDQRGIEEGGGSILNSVYRFIFSMMQPPSILNRMSTLFKRNYSQGSVAVVENRPGYCLLQFDIPKDMYGHLLRQNSIGYKHVLKLAGAKTVRVSNTDTATKDGYIVKTEIQYH